MFSATSKQIASALLMLWMFFGAPQVNAQDFQLIKVMPTQYQGDWEVIYQLRYLGSEKIHVDPDDISAEIQGRVSNSSVPGHSLDFPLEAKLTSINRMESTAEIIKSPQEDKTCRQHVLLRLTQDQALTQSPLPHPMSPLWHGGIRDISAQRGLLLLEGCVLHARLVLAHNHIIYGDYDPLLGKLNVEIQLGKLKFNHQLDLNREQYHALPSLHFPTPPEDRRDTRQYVSAPDSLHLEAHVDGNRHYRFPERPVRYSTKMRLRFWYLLANGTEGEVVGRLLQYKDTPIAYRALTDGNFELCLSSAGRWVKVERVFWTESEATLIALEFKIMGDERVGEVWIDNVSVEPVVMERTGP